VRSSAWQSLRHGHVRRTHRTDDGKMTSLFSSSLNNVNQVLSVLRFQVAKLRLTQYKIMSITGEAFAIDHVIVVLRYQFLVRLSRRVASWRSYARTLRHLLMTSTTSQTHSSTFLDTTSGNIIMFENWSKKYVFNS
jgi:hypothetical protein